MTRFAPAALLLAMCALATASCQVTDSAQSDQSVPVASVSPGDPGQPANSSMPTLRAASPGCAAMDAVFTEALASSETGQAYSTVASRRPGETTADERHHAWEAFAATLRNDYATQLSAAATDDTAREALAALNVYVDRNAALDSGAIPEYADQAAAQEALKRGEKPETNPPYAQARAAATGAHATHTTCTPHWPVVF